MELIYLSLLMQMVVGHSNMLYPPVRGNLEFWGYCSRGWGCNTACDAPKSQSKIDSPYVEKITVKRGETIPIKWLRQNHPGGFVRIAFTSFDQSDNNGAFDSNAVKYVCYETNCRQSEHNPMLGENNGPGSQECSTSVTIPDNIPDGKLTLQWIWFGGGVLFADNKASFANYVSCSDLIIQGGASYQSHQIKSTFQGGDAVTSDPQQCRYWSTNSVFGCPNGAEDKNEAGCGYGDAKFGSPAEWEGSNNEVQPIPGQEKPVYNDEKPVVDEQKPVIDEQKPVVDEVKPTYPEGNNQVPGETVTPPEVPQVNPDVPAPQSPPEVPQINPDVPAPRSPSEVPQVAPEVPATQPLPEIKPEPLPNNNGSSVDIYKPVELPPSPPSYSTTPHRPRKCRRRQPALYQTLSLTS